MGFAHEFKSAPQEIKLKNLPDEIVLELLSDELGEHLPWAVYLGINDIIFLEAQRNINDVLNL